MAAAKEVIAICQSGGRFTSDEDGSWSYIGGEAHAIDVNEETSFEDFKAEVAEMCNCCKDNMILKYFLPTNNKTLITVSREEDLQRMIRFCSDSGTVELFVMLKEAAAQNIDTMVASRSSRTTLSDDVASAIAPVDEGDIDEEKLETTSDYKPENIMEDIKREHGVHARRATDIAKQQLLDSFKDAYAHLPFFCEKIKETNPGSVATCTRKDDSNFHRLYVSFHAMIAGFQQGCRPLLFLDSTPLNTIYQGSLNLLSATAADADDGIFPLAFAVVDVEDEVNWRWFLQELKSTVSMSNQITFIADTQNGLKKALAEVFEDCYHSYCVHHLAEKLKRELKGQFSDEEWSSLINDFYSAAHALSLEAYLQAVVNLEGISSDAFNWVIQSEPKHWANALFRGARYDHTTSNFGQPFYGWVSEAYELSIPHIINLLQGKMMEAIHKRREDSNSWTTKLTPSNEEKLRKETSKACSLQVLLQEGNIFEVCGESTEVVDVDNLECSCNGWKITGLPCCHAIAVLECLGRSPYDYCSKYFTTESYRLTYAESMFPVPNIDFPGQDESAELTDENHNHGLRGCDTDENLNQELRDCDTDEMQIHGLRDCGTDGNQNQGLRDCNTDENPSHGLGDCDTDEIQNHEIRDCDTDEKQNHGLRGCGPDESQNHGLRDCNTDENPSHGLGDCHTDENQKRGLRDSDTDENQKRGLSVFDIDENLNLKRDCDTDENQNCGLRDCGTDEIQIHELEDCITDENLSQELRVCDNDRNLNQGLRDCDPGNQNHELRDSCTDENQDHGLSCDEKDKGAEELHVPSGAITRSNVKRIKHAKSVTKRLTVGIRRSKRHLLTECGPKTRSKVKRNKHS